MAVGIGAGQSLAEVRLPSEGQRGVRTIGSGSDLLEGRAGRHGRHRAVLWNRHVLGARTKRALTVAENSVSYFERYDAVPRRILI